MAKYKYQGEAGVVGRFGRLEPGATVDLYQSEIDYMARRGDKTFKPMDKPDLEGIGEILPVKTEHFDLTAIKWTINPLKKLATLSGSAKMKVLDAMRSIGCKVPEYAEAKRMTPIQLINAIHVEFKRLQWDHPDMVQEPEPHNGLTIGPFDLDEVEENIVDIEEFHFKGEIIGLLILLKDGTTATYGNISSNEHAPCESITTTYQNKEEFRSEGDEVIIGVRYTFEDGTVIAYGTVPPPEEDKTGGDGSNDEHPATFKSKEEFKDTEGNVIGVRYVLEDDSIKEFGTIPPVEDTKTPETPPEAPKPEAPKAAPKKIERVIKRGNGK